MGIVCGVRGTGIILEQDFGRFAPFLAKNVTKIWSVGKTKNTHA